MTNNTNVVDSQRTAEQIRETNEQVADATAAARQAQRAARQAEANNRQLSDINNNIKQNSFAGDPAKATTSQLITGNY